MAPLRRWMGVAAATVLGAALAIGGVFGASAVGAAAQADGSLELVAQSSWVDDGGIFNLQVRAAGARPDASVVVNVYPPLDSRAELTEQLPADDQPILVIGPQALDDLQDTSNEVLSFELAVSGPGIDRVDAAESDDDQVPVLETDVEAAVYPVEIVLRDVEGNPADTIRTTLINLPRGFVGPPLQVVMLLESTLPLGLGEGGEPVLPEEAGVDLGAILEAFALHPDTAISLSLAPESIVALDRSEHEAHQEIATDLVEVLDGTELFSSPYVDVDEEAWVGAGLESELAQLYVVGDAAVRRVLGVDPDASVAVLDPTITADGLDWLVEQGIQGVIVDDGRLVGLDPTSFDQSFTRRFLVPTATGRAVPALQTDRRLAAHFAETDNPVLNANRMLADLALLALEGSAQRRTVVVAAPPDWTPSLSFLNVLLSGFERVPIIETATAADALANTEFLPATGDGTISPPLRRELRPIASSEPLGAFRTEFSQAEAAITSWRTVVAADPGATELLSELLVVSTDERLESEERSRYIDTIYRLIDEQKTSAITTPPSDAVTITGREATVPLVIENELDVAAAVLVVLDSEKLVFPEGREVELVLAPGQNRIEIPIEARASGDSPIRVQILSPDRSVLLGSSELLVRTLAFSGVGVFIGIAAIIVLLLWWLRQRRSSRATLQAAAERPPSPAEAYTGAVNS